MCKLLNVLSCGFVIFLLCVTSAYSTPHGPETYQRTIGSPGWFPIGWFLDAHKVKSLNHPTDPDLNIGYDPGVNNLNGDLWDMAYRYEIGYAYNCIYARPYEDARIRTTQITYGPNQHGVRRSDALGATYLYNRMLDTMSTLNSSSYSDGLSRNYKMLAPVLAKMGDDPRPPLVVPPHFLNSAPYNFSALIRLPWDLFSAHSYYPTSFSWPDEDSSVNTLVNYIKNHSCLGGWVFCDEPFGGHSAQDQETNFPWFRRYVYDQLCHFKEIITNNDSNHLVFGSVRNYGNYWNTYDPNSRTVFSPPSYQKDLMDVFDCIMDSGLYMTDIQSPGRANEWQHGDYVAQSALTFTDAPYLRWMEAYTGNWDKNDLVPERYRYMAYSSWVNGGQGVMFYNLNGTVSSSWYDWTDEIAQEAYVMKDWLMGQHATDISANISIDTGDDHRVRFILKRSTNPADSRLLLMFSVSSNNSSINNGNRNVYINFPNHRVSGRTQIINYYNWSSNLQDNDHTIHFGTKDVWGRALLISLVED